MSQWTISLMLRKIEGGRRRKDRGWDGWMASLTWWTWVWVGSGSWWWTGKPGVLQSMGSQRAGDYWAIELNWTICTIKKNSTYNQYHIIFIFFCLTSLVVQQVKNLPVMQETWVQSWGWEDPWSRERLPTPVVWPGEFHELYSPWGCRESNMTEWL